MTGDRRVGGLVGSTGFDDSGTTQQSYFDKQATNQSESAGNATGLTTAEMQGQAARTNMSGFEFGVDWQTQTDPADYPVLISLQQGTEPEQQQPTAFEISALDPQDATVNVSEAFDVSATVENTGNLQGEQEIELLTEPEDVTVLTNATVSLDPGANTTVTFNNVTVDIAGEFNQTVASANDSVSGSLSIEEPPTATVTFDNQSVQNGSTSVTVGSATFDGSEDFVIVVHRASPGKDGVVDGPTEIGNKIGSSDVLTNNTVSDIPVNLTKNLDEGENTQLTENQTLVAMLHFVNESGDQNFESRITRDGTPVFDQADITVTARVSVEGRDNLQFGQVNAIPDGDSTVTGNLTLSNPGERPVGITQVTVTGNDTGEFAVTSEPDITPNGSEENITVEFTPVTWGDSDVLINISTNATRPPQVSIPASGTGIAPEISVSTQLIQFGDVPVSASNTESEVLTIQNDGNTDLSITISSNSSITTNQVNPFGTNRSDQTIILPPPDEQENIDIIFNPPEGGTLAGSLTIETTSSFTESVKIRLSGVGSEGAISVQPEQIDLGNLTIGDSERARALVENNGPEPITVSPQVTTQQTSIRL